MLGKRLKELRERHELTQKETAIAINKTPQAYNYYEKGSREPDIETLKKMADLFTVSIDYLVGHSTSVSHTPLKITEEELEHIKKYRTLDERGKQAVDENLEREYANSLKTMSNEEYGKASA